MICKDNYFELICKDNFGYHLELTCKDYLVNYLKLPTWSPVRHFWPAATRLWLSFKKCVNSFRSSFFFIDSNRLRTRMIWLRWQWWQDSDEKAPGQGWRWRFDYDDNDYETLMKKHLDGTNRSSPHSFSTALIATWSVIMGDCLKRDFKNDHGRDGKQNS